MNVLWSRTVFIFEFASTHWSCYALHVLKTVAELCLGRDKMCSYPEQIDRNEEDVPNKHMCVVSHYFLSSN